MFKSSTGKFRLSTLEAATHRVVCPECSGVMIPEDTSLNCSDCSCKIENQTIENLPIKMIVSSRRVSPLFVDEVLYISQILESRGKSEEASELNAIVSSMMESKMAIMGEVTESLRLLEAVESIMSRTENGMAIASNIANIRISVSKRLKPKE